MLPPNMVMLIFSIKKKDFKCRLSFHGVFLLEKRRVAALGKKDTVYDISLSLAVSDVRHQSQQILMCTQNVKIQRLQLKK